MFPLKYGLPTLVIIKTIAAKCNRRGNITLIRAISGRNGRKLQ